MTTDNWEQITAPQREALAAAHKRYNDMKQARTEVFLKVKAVEDALSELCKKEESFTDRFTRDRKIQQLQAESRQVRGQYMTLDAEESEARKGIERAQWYFFEAVANLGDIEIKPFDDAIVACEVWQDKEKESLKAERVKVIKKWADRIRKTQAEFEFSVDCFTVNQINSLKG